MTVLDSSLSFLQRFENKMKLSGIKLDFSSLPLTLSNLLAHSCRNQVVEVSEKPSRDTETEIFKHISIAVESFSIYQTLGKCLIYFQDCLEEKLKVQRFFTLLSGLWCFSTSNCHSYIVPHWANHGICRECAVRKIQCYYLHR